MSTRVDVSVVIGFKDWGLDRLKLSIQSIIGSFGPLTGEVIVSDYGSQDSAEAESEVTELGARYIYTETDGTWSRSRALNAGFAISVGNVLVSTDADMIFSPGSMAVIGEMALTTDNLSLLLQCRDLPESCSHSEIAEHGFDWELFDSRGRLRPRWGMGGMMASSRDAYERVRGFDERMHTYGGEDIDYVYRVRRAGQRIVWLDDPKVRMFHMWHPPTRGELDKSAAHLRAIEANKKIVYEDSTYVRNTMPWKFPIWDAKPLVTVAISTFNRATYLKDSINSVLNQTMQDFEILVIDDGSTDETKSVVEAFGDRRIRYIHQENQGISVARNRAADEAQGRYTAVLDDDDLMTPWRLEKHLEHIHSGFRGSFGSFVNFDEQSGDMKLFASKKLNAGTILQSGGAPGHGTWMVETEVIRRVNYDESLTSGVDNNLALRMVRAGVSMQHTGEIMMLRRMHPGQLTLTDESNQKTSAQQSRKLFEFTTTVAGSEYLKDQRGPDDWVKVRLGNELNELIPFLPDSLVERTAIIIDWPEGLDHSFLSSERLAESALVEMDQYENVVSLHGRLTNLALEDMGRLRSAGVSYEISAVLKNRVRTESVEQDDTGGPSALPTAVSHRALRFKLQHNLPVVGSVALSAAAETTCRGRLTIQRLFRDGDQTHPYLFIGFDDIDDALTLSASPGFEKMEFIADGSFADTFITEPSISGVIAK